eukprot:gb/GECH01010171.1/.p1 GENE.gb/GECH01010171.1/~~gb/GECH01010171.1/.p1  ORF type:complete len:606 (+),score=43.33 gb/GECH01010171.1/:1-1818(+)
MSNDDERIVLAGYHPNGTYKLLARLKEVHREPPHTVQVFGENKLEDMYFTEFEGIHKLPFGRYNSRQWMAFLAYWQTQEAREDEEADLPNLQDLKRVINFQDGELEAPRSLDSFLRRTNAHFVDFPWEIKTEIDQIQNSIASLRGEVKWNEVTRDLSWLATLARARDIVDNIQNLQPTKELALTRLIYSIIEQTIQSCFKDQKIQFDGDVEIKNLGVKPDFMASWKKIPFLYEEDKWRNYRWRDHPDLIRVLSLMYNSIVDFFQDYKCENSMYVIGILNSGYRCTIFFMEGTLHKEQRRIETRLFSPLFGGFGEDFDISVVLAALKFLVRKVLDSISNVEPRYKDGMKLNYIPVPKSGESISSSSTGSSRSTRSQIRKESRFFEGGKKKSLAMLEGLQILDRSKSKGKLVEGIYDRETVLLKHNCSFFECEVWPSLEHPNIIKCYEGCVHSGVVVMEKWSDVRVKWTTLRSFAYQLLEALEYLHHSKGVIHRDVKRRNILYSADRLKLADFGLSCFISDAPTDKCGTKGYMAPELRKRKVYDEKVDLYSAGVTLYKEFHKIQEECGSCPWPDEERQAFFDLLQGTTEKNPRDRFSASEAIKYLSF